MINMINNDNFNARTAENFGAIAKLFGDISSNGGIVDPQIQELINRLLAHQEYGIELSQDTLNDNFRMAAFIDSKELSGEFSAFIGCIPTAENLLDVDDMAQKSLDDFDFNYDVPQEQRDAAVLAAQLCKEFKAKLSPELQEEFWKYGETSDHADEFEVASAYRCGYKQAMKVFTGNSNAN